MKDFLVNVMDKLAEEVVSNPRAAVYVILILAFGFLVAASV